MSGVLKPFALAVFYPVSTHESYLNCAGVCIDSPLASSQRTGRNQSRYTDLACFPDTTLLWRIIIQLQICVGVVYYHLERESFDSCSHRHREAEEECIMCCMLQLYRHWSSIFSFILTSPEQVTPLCWLMRKGRLMGLTNRARTGFGQQTSCHTTTYLEHFSPCPSCC